MSNFFFVMLTTFILPYQKNKHFIVQYILIYVTFPSCLKSFLLLIKDYNNFLDCLDQFYFFFKVQDFVYAVSIHRWININLLKQKNRKNSKIKFGKLNKNNGHRQINQWLISTLYESLSFTALICKFKVWIGPHR